MNVKKSVVAVLVFVYAMSLFGCKTNADPTNDKLSHVEVVTDEEYTTESTEENTNATITDITVDDFLKNVKKSLDSLDSLETDVYVNNEINVKFAKLLTDDLGYNLSDVKELDGKFEDYFYVKVKNHMNVKFDTDVVYVLEELDEENEFIELISKDQSSVHVESERYIELNDKQRMFERTYNDDWSTSEVSDLSSVTANPVQTAIEFLNDFEANSDKKIPLDDIIVIEGTVSSETAMALTDGHISENKRVPAQIEFDNENKQLKSIELDLIGVCDDKYLFELLNPSTLENENDISEYATVSRYDLSMTFSNANSVDVAIPEDLLDKTTGTETSTDIEESDTE